LSEGRHAHGEFEAVTSAAVGQAAHAADGVEEGGVKVEAVVGKSIADMDMDDFAEDDVAAGGPARVGSKDLERSALEGERGFEDAWRTDGARRCGGQADGLKLACSVGQRFGGSDGLANEGSGDDVDDELTLSTFGVGLAVSEGVLLGPVVLVGGAEEEGHGVGADAGEEGEGGEILFTFVRNCRDKGDGSWHNTPDQQFVAFGDLERVRGEIHARRIAERDRGLEIVER
jgi:hypothetical protein